MEKYIATLHLSSFDLKENFAQILQRRFWLMASEYRIVRGHRGRSDHSDEMNRHD